MKQKEKEKKENYIFERKKKRSMYNKEKKERKKVACIPEKIKNK